MILSYFALLCGYVADLIFGDPHNMPHLIKLMGSTISLLEKILYKRSSKNSMRLRGAVLVLIMIFLYGFVPFVLLKKIYELSKIAGFIAETFICYQMLAAKSLYTESRKVYESLKVSDIDAARHNVSMIVGRDTQMLDREGITRAAVETVAENASDGVAAPLIYMAVGGGALGMFYKAVNTMDSMLGYRNERYMYFGTAAAKLDDILNYIPSRVCAVFMICASWVLKLDYRNALKIFLRDRYNHKSPNSAQTESVCAGALGVRLAGNAYYFGKLYEKPYIGDALREIECEDIIRANKLMFTTQFLIFLFLTAIVLVAGAIY